MIKFETRFRVWEFLIRISDLFRFSRFGFRIFEKRCLMRASSLALALGLALSAPASARADLRNFDDAPLHAIQFVDAQEGWAVGDEGVVWHTIDGGKKWE